MKLMLAFVLIWLAGFRIKTKSFEYEFRGGLEILLDWIVSNKAEKNLDKRICLRCKNIMAEIPHSTDDKKLHHCSVCGYTIVEGKV